MKGFDNMEDNDFMELMGSLIKDSEDKKIIKLVMENDDYNKIVDLLIKDNEKG